MCVGVSAWFEKNKQKNNIVASVNRQNYPQAFMFLSNSESHWKFFFLYRVCVLRCDLYYDLFDN